jgi:hypothetical protein
LKSHDYHVLM